MTGKNIADVAVVGAGAAGLMAAICAAEQGAGVLLLEKQDKPGRKLLMTGSGRCNLTHLDPDIASAYHSSDISALPTITDTLFSCAGVEVTLRKFEELGLWCHNRDGYVYPRSDQAASVLQVLLKECQRLGVKMKYQTCITGIRKTSAPEALSGSCWELVTEGWIYRAEKVILAGGSPAGLTEKTDFSEKQPNSLLKAAAALGHRTIDFAPALTGIQIRDKRLSAAAGARTDANIVLLEEDTSASGKNSPAVPYSGWKQAASESGQIQWNKDGISGICVMQLSGSIPSLLKQQKKTAVLIDFVPDMSTERLEHALQRQCSKHKDGDLLWILQGFVPDRIALMLTSMFKDLPAESRNAHRLAYLLKYLLLPVQGVRGFSQAQAASGGVALTEIHPETMESIHCPGLYFAGELLNADGPCGGYNLQWAWSTGITAGTDAGRQNQRETLSV